LNDDNKLNKKIQVCLDIENNISKINEINQKIENCKTKARIVPENENELSEFLKRIKIFVKILFEIPETLKFKFRNGENYSVSNNGLIATKTSEGDNWNCTIIGDKEIAKNKIS